MPGLRPPSTSVPDHHLGMAFPPLYTTTVKITGGAAHHTWVPGVMRSDDARSICS